MHRTDHYEIFRRTNKVSGKEGFWWRFVYANGKKGSGSLEPMDSLSGVRRAIKTVQLAHSYSPTIIPFTRVWDVDRKLWIAF